MKRILAARGFMSVTGVLVLVAATMFAYYTALAPPKKMQAYCATMPDTIGLYVGSHVTVRGIAVGAVTALAPGDEYVRVDFEVDADHPLRGGVSAATVSDTLVADRDLAVLFDGNASAKWDPRQCITRTLTAKSITETLDAVSKLASELGGGGDPGASRQVRDGVAALREATAGTGPALNTLINELGTALRSPDAAIGHLGELIDALSSLAQTLSINWDEVEAAITRLGPGFEFINDSIFGQAIPIIDHIGTLLIWVNTIIRPYGGPVLDGLEATVPYLRMLAAHIGSLQEIITMIPPIASAFGGAADPVSGDSALVYAAPKVALAQPDADNVCAALNALSPGACAGSGDHLATVELSQLLFAVVGGR
ncbi:MlaD family protein [Nocardia pseudovaccinii]|uniref:MlaD family protein n=1 Tax=Nocardia pseudovaccinii TaxID=189540 RepID=UPI0007A4F87B|nr:MlaD family protein [Nocardia pseudovaccinii]